MKARTLSGQIYVYFIIVIVLSLTSVGVVSYFQSSKALDVQVEKYMSQTINNALYQTDIYLQTYELVSNSIISSSDVRNFLEIDKDDSYAYFDYSNQINRYVMPPLFTLYRQLNLVYLIGDQGRSIFYDNQNQRALDERAISERYKMLVEKTPDNGALTILNESVRPEDKNLVITMARKIRGAASYDYKGVLAIEFRVQELSNIWDGFDIGKDGYFFIVDENGRYVYHPDKNLLGTELAGELGKNVLTYDKGMFTEKAGGKERLYVSRESAYSKWHLVVSMPVDELRKPIATIRTTTLVVGFITLIVALWLAYRFGKSIVAPIRELKEGMRETEKGNWQYIGEFRRNDEIGGLIHSYNLMVTRLQEMIKKVYETELINQKNELELQLIELERHKAEFQSLQLQINPHFMYNTLETINCYAIVKDSGEISEIVEALAFMLRYSVQTNLEEITVANELNHVRNYLNILKHRIGREFEVDVVIPPSLLLEKMVRLTLQPVVENIFQHAFFNGIEPHHYIRIDAKKENELFIVTVEDNGSGIPPEKLLKLQQQLSENKLADEPAQSGYRRGGIGMMNVHRRIQIVFGEKYGLSIQSELGSGTRVTLTMPSDKLVAIGSAKPAGSSIKSTMS
ncbi:sensor histidine kinase [Paenibacillus thalictri]|uniref:histidine kinase n=1 Tax=Paenibacillus thalictri TaxID=2527873 RepID=A0A4Q9DPK8_9BACL|nr:sensor histidine kinase [Paenibacillus thalictri]TBL78245.1 HAMP domain-containing protein [Paenibacillus thalictri]